MSSAGNDIVALGTVNKKRTGQFRFYSKILSVSEQALYQQPRFADMPFEHYVWLLWSVKESAFKYLKRLKPGLIFSPTKTIIHQLMIPAEQAMSKPGLLQWENTGADEEFCRGVVVLDHNVLFFRSKFSEDWIVTVVNDEEDFNNVCWGARSIGSSGRSEQSASARSLLLSKLNSFLPGDHRVEKHSVGYPVVMKGPQDMHIPVSLAHDGRFVAYSFKIHSPGSN